MSDLFFKKKKLSIQRCIQGLRRTADLLACDSDAMTKSIQTLKVISAYVDGS